MKTIFRSVNMAALTAVVLTLGAVAGFAQDPTPSAPADPNCSNSAAISAARDNITALFQKKDLESLRLRIEAGKQFQEKYKACGSSVEDMLTYLEPNVPKWETDYKKRKDIEMENALVKRFDDALKAKNWDEVYAAGKEVIAKYPDKYRPAEIVLGSIGYDEAYKGNNKYNDDTLKYAKMSIADLESGKPFVLGTATSFGLGEFKYADKEDALGWLNLYIGYITQVGQKNKKDAQPFLFKATQLVSPSSKSQVSKQPIPYGLIGDYYFDEIARLSGEIKVIADSQKPEDTPEVAKQKVDEIEAKVALANGYAERAMDAYARAYTLGVAKAYKDLMYDNLKKAFNARYGKTDTLTPAWIAEAVKKPLPNPTTPVAPIADPKPGATTTGGTGTGVGAATGTGVGAATGTGVGAATGTGVGGGRPSATPVSNPPKAKRQ